MITSTPNPITGAYTDTGLPEGYTPSEYDKNQAKALGLSDAQYFALQQSIGGPSLSVAGGPTGQANYGANQTTSGSASKIGQFVSAVRAAGGGQQQPATPAKTTVDVDPTRVLENLGAAALGEQAVYNPNPGQADIKSGVGPATKPQVTTNVPTMPYGPWSPNYRPGQPDPNAKVSPNQGLLSGDIGPRVANAAAAAAVGVNPAQQTNPNFQGSVFGPRGTITPPSQTAQINPQVPATAAAVTTPTPFAIPPTVPALSMNTAPAAPGGGGVIPKTDLPFAHNDLQAEINQHLNVAMKRS